jgi:hypothetical protein
MSVNISNRLCTKRLRNLDWILGREQIIFVPTKSPMRANISVIRYRGFSYGGNVAEVEGQHSLPSSVEGLLLNFTSSFLPDAFMVSSPIKCINILTPTFVLSYDSHKHC